MQPDAWLRPDIESTELAYCITAVNKLCLVWLANPILAACGI